MKPNIALADRVVDLGVASVVTHGLGSSKDPDSNFVGNRPAGGGIANGVVEFGAATRLTMGIGSLTDPDSNHVGTRTMGGGIART